VAYVLDESGEGGARGVLRAGRNKRWSSSSHCRIQEVADIGLLEPCRVQPAAAGKGAARRCTRPSPASSASSRTTYGASWRPRLGCAEKGLSQTRLRWAHSTKTCWTPRRGGELNDGQADWFHEFGRERGHVRPPLERVKDWPDPSGYEEKTPARAGRAHGLRHAVLHTGALVNGLANGLPDPQPDPE